MADSPFPLFGELCKAFRQHRRLTQEQLAVQAGVHRNTIGRWERGDGLPGSRSMVLELARLLALDAQETRELLLASLTALSPIPICYLPIARNPLFTGREALLQRVHERLQAGAAGPQPPVVALQGLGGMGKTQVAVEYAHRHVQDYETILWLEAASAENLLSGVMLLTAVLELPEQHAAEQERVLAALTRWLAEHHGWLLLWDNLEDVELLERVLPAVHQGSILITTRRQAVGPRVQGIELESLTTEEGMHLLLRRAKVLGAATGESLQQFAEQAPEEHAAARELVRLLEGLPLALDQVGAYVEETGSSLAHYLDQYELHRQQLLARRGTPTVDHPASVAATFELVYERVAATNAAAGELLCLCAFLAPEAIPEELIQKATPHLGPILEPIAADSYQLDMALAALRSFSLIQRQSEAQLLSIHRLVQAVIRDQMDSASLRLWAERAVRAVNAAFPQVEIPNWQQCERYVPHALVCRQLIEAEEIKIPETAQLLQQVGHYLMDRARYAEAAPCLEQALTIQEQQQGPDELAVASISDLLGLLYRYQGKYEQAESLLLRSLTIRERELDPAHPQTVQVLSDLAGVYWNRGEWGLAEQLWERTLVMREEQLGLDHPDTIESLNNVGFAYLRSGKYEGAEPLLQRALAICEKKLGSFHPLTSNSLANLGELYSDQGQYKRAETLLQRALAIHEQQLGPSHFYTATCLFLVGKHFHWQGKYEQAEPPLQRAVAICEQQLGPDHSRTALCLQELALLYRDQGRYEQAEPLLQRALAICERHLGPDHPHTVIVLQNLGAFYRDQGKNEQAESLLQRTASKSM